MLSLSKHPRTSCLLVLAAVAFTGPVVRSQPPPGSGLNQQQLNGLAALGRLYMTMGTFGANLSAGVGMYGSPSLPVGSLANPHANPYGPGGLANSPYGSGAGQNPYSSGYGMYYEDPYGAYLRGAAQVIDSQGRFLLSQQQAYLLREKYRAERVTSRRKVFEEVAYEHENTPTIEDERRRRQSQSAQRALNNPPVTEIWSGKSLNDILVDLQKQPASGVRTDRSSLPGLLDKADLKHIHVTRGTGSVALLKNDGRLQWPVALAGSVYLKTKERLTTLAQESVRQAKVAARVEAGNIQLLTDELDKLHKQLRTDGRDLSASDYIEAKHFLGHFNDAIVALRQGDVSDHLTGHIALKVDTVAELVVYMTEHGLHFAPALPGDRKAYAALHQAVASYGLSRQSETTNRRSPRSEGLKGTY